MYAPVTCPVCKDTLGAAHKHQHGGIIQRHVADKHPEIWTEAQAIEEKIRDFRRRHGWLILKTR